MADSRSNPVKEGDLLAGKYRVERVLGTGGMGVVVAARHIHLDQHVAIKFVRDDALDNEDAVARFLREARAAVKLRSEHAAKVLDVGTLESGAPYMVMEFLEGSDLSAVLNDNGPLPVEDVAEYIMQACEAVAEAHAFGIVHRDLKPQNLFLTQTVGGGARVKVLDFGVSKTLQGDPSTGGGLTQTRSMLGSPLYMSPEQMRSSRDVDARSDVWAFGIVLFQLLTGRWPFEADSMPELVLKVVTEPAVSIKEYRKDVPEALVAIIDKCLAKKPDDRYPTAAELGLALEPFAPPGSRISIERSRAGTKSTMRRPPSSVAADTSRGEGSMRSGNTPSRGNTPSAWGSGKGETPATAANTIAENVIPEKPPEKTPDRVPLAVAETMPAAVLRPRTESSKGEDLPKPPESAKAEPRTEAKPDAKPETKPADAKAADAAKDAPSPRPSVSPKPSDKPASAAAAAKPRNPAVMAGVIGAVAVLGLGVWQLTKSPSSPAASDSASAAASASAPPPVVSAEIEEGRTESFGPLPTVVSTDSNPLSDEKIALGRMLFYEPRLSKSQEVSCNTCHLLDKYGVDGKKVSTGHAQQQGTRNSPSVYNSAGYFALMWDGRFPNVEEQATGPLTNPVEMASSSKRVEQTLRSIPQYVQAFAAAFPGEKQPVTYENTTKAIGAFERKLFSPSRWEKFLAGDKAALTGAEKAGFNTFVDTGCPTCHFGPYVGATMFQKLGLVKAWPTTRDRGKFELTKKNEDYMVFRVPSLRNVVMTAPYLHDGSISDLHEVVRMMARHQIGKELKDPQIDSIIAWLGALTGELPTEYIKKPDLPPSTRQTPAPDLTP